MQVPGTVLPVPDSSTCNLYYSIIVLRVVPCNKHTIHLYLVHVCTVPTDVPVKDTSTRILFKTYVVRSMLLRVPAKWIRKYNVLEHYSMNTIVRGTRSLTSKTSRQSKCMSCVCFEIQYQVLYVHSTPVHSSWYKLVCTVPETLGHKTQ